MDGSEADTTYPAPPGNDSIRGSVGNTKSLDRNGWDGKARVERKAVITNPEALSDPEFSDEDAPPLEQIDADEGGCMLALGFLVFADQGHGVRFA